LEKNKKRPERKASSSGAQAHRTGGAEQPKRWGLKDKLETLGRDARPKKNLKKKRWTRRKIKENRVASQRDNGPPREKGGHVEEITWVRKAAEKKEDKVKNGNDIHWGFWRRERGLKRSPDGMFK